jgi:UDP-N-acetylglucosamine--N-acetylmuramyl-(pentapeptide) pyrophosphoryl-undecaprenol N-acetylglucosamine transferase
MRVAIAAAGTGGHVFPALAVGEALLELGLERQDVLFLGGNRMAATLVPEAGFPFVGFELTRLRRSLSVENLRIPAVVRRASAAMAEEVRRHGAGVMLGMSGYVVVPAALAARRASVPFFLQEQNASPGLAARFAARSAVASFLGFPGRAERLPRSEVVGNPLRPSLAGFDRHALRRAARLRYGLDGSATVVGILGGSQGAAVLNEAAPRIVAAGTAGAVLHITGSEAHAEVARWAGGSPLPWVTRPFESEIEHFYAAADLVVCRAGAMTVSELAATGTPSVLVPLERVGQHHNAAVLAAAGAARVVRQTEVGLLPEIVTATLADETRLAAMAAGAREVARPDAAAVIARRILEAGP